MKDALRIIEISLLHPMVRGCCWKKKKNIIKIKLSIIDWVYLSSYLRVLKWIFTLKLILSSLNINQLVAHHKPNFWTLKFFALERESIPSGILNYLEILKSFPSQVFLKNTCEQLLSSTRINFIHYPIFINSFKGIPFSEIWHIPQNTT